MVNDQKNTLAIDFGTSNSAVATFENGSIKRIPIERDSDTLPTAIFFDFEAQKIRIGSAANDGLLQGVEGRYMRSLKRVLGTSLMHEKRLIMGRRFDFIDIIAGFLSELKIRTEQSEGKVFTHALSGRPVQFHDDATKDGQAEIDLRECYLRAGFEDVEFMYEPEAAALANNVLSKASSLGLIVDIGGGTSDFSIFRSNSGSPDTTEILGSYGKRFGGTDFDKTLNLTKFMPLLGKGAPLRRVLGTGTATAPISMFNDLATWEKIPFMYSPETLRMAQDLERHAIDRAPFKRLLDVLEYQLGHELSILAENAKITANGAAGPSSIDLGLLEKGREIELQQGDIGRMMAPHRAEIIASVQQTLSLATCNHDEITDVIFVGGSSLMTFVVDALSETLPNAVFHTTAVFTAVVDGLAIAAAKA